MTLEAMILFVSNILTVLASPGGLDIVNRLVGENNLTPQAILAEVIAGEKPGPPTGAPQVQIIVNPEGKP
jgi:hypothetical protein